ncbi:hypothetical protein VTN00DRAFT_6314 [Thermoascus crustaceus]|uniref:uncharacterized protein n=1 Tax=Thermoascus crustaceus TaxID=5088 RepID=UPI003742DDB6
MRQHTDVEAGNVPALPTSNFDVNTHATSPSFCLRNWRLLSPLQAQLSSLGKSLSWRNSEESLYDDADDQIIVRDLQSSPRGYPNLAAFLDSDENFAVYRRFGYLQSRLLLEKQDELRILEEELDHMDQISRESQLVTRDLAEMDAEPRRELFARIEKKFHEYANLLTTAQQLTSMNRPSRSDYQSVVNYMANNKPLIRAERSFIRHREDLVTLRPGREHAWLDSAIEHALRIFHCRFIEYLFCSKETQMKTGGDKKNINDESDVIAVYYTRSRINAVANCIVVSMVVLLLVVPVYVLFHLLEGTNSDKAYAISVGVLLVFILAFSAVLHLFTRARRHEILGAAAAVNNTDIKTVTVPSSLSFWATLVFDPSLQDYRSTTGLLIQPRSYIHIFKALQLWETLRFDVY